MESVEYEEIIASRLKFIDGLSMKERFNELISFPNSITKKMKEDFESRDEPHLVIDCLFSSNGSTMSC